MWMGRNSNLVAGFIYAHTNAGENIYSSKKMAKQFVCVMHILLRTGWIPQSSRSWETADSSNNEERRIRREEIELRDPHFVFH